MVWDSGDKHHEHARKLIDAACKFMLNKGKLPLPDLAWKDDDIVTIQIEGKYLKELRRAIKLYHYREGYWK